VSARGRRPGRAVRYCLHGVNLTEPGRVCVHGCELCYACVGVGGSCPRCEDSGVEPVLPAGRYVSAGQPAGLVWDGTRWSLEVQADEPVAGTAS
jgi:hypothetical protein